MDTRSPQSVSWQWLERELVKRIEPGAARRFRSTLARMLAHRSERRSSARNREASNVRQAR
jgi:hypothetical protein